MPFWMLLVLCLFAAPAALVTPAFPQGGSGTASALAAWEDQLQRAQEDLLAARVRVRRAEDAYRDWRQRKYPRGAKKGELLVEIEEARATLVAAQAAWPEVLERVRRAGAPRGLLRRFESPPASTEDGS